MYWEAYLRMSFHFVKSVCIPSGGGGGGGEGGRERESWGFCTRVRYCTVRNVLYK